MPDSKIIGPFQMSCRLARRNRDKAAARVCEAAEPEPTSSASKAIANTNRSEDRQGPRRVRRRITIEVEETPMKTIEKPVADQLQKESVPFSQSDSGLPESRFDLMFGRMKGTVIINGDIVNPDPELWNCEFE